MISPRELMQVLIDTIVLIFMRTHRSFIRRLLFLNGKWPSEPWRT